MVKKTLDYKNIPEIKFVLQVITARRPFAVFKVVPGRAVETYTQRVLSKEIAVVASEHQPENNSLRVFTYHQHGGTQMEFVITPPPGGGNVTCELDQDAKTAVFTVLNNARQVQVIYIFA